MDVSNTTPLVEFSFGNMGTSTLSFGSLPAQDEYDTVIAVNLASPQVLNTDVTVTIKLDNSLVTKFNAANPDNQLLIIPDSVFAAPKTITLTIPAGYRIRKIPIALNTNKLDPTVSYAIPYTISSVKAADGSKIIVSGNAGSIMYAFIGNPIAGNYTHQWIRYNNAGGTGSPAFDQTFDDAAIPVSPTEVEFPSGSAGLMYDVTFTDPKTGLSGLKDFKVTFTSESVAGSGVTISVDPVLVTVDAVKGIYEFNYQYLNAAGAPRNITDKFTKQ